MSDDLYYPLDYHLCDLKVKGAVSDPWYWKRRERFSRDFPCSTVQPSWAGLKVHDPVLGSGDMVATRCVELEPGFPMWHPSAKLSVARNRSKGKSDGLCRQDHARQHEIESEWDMVAFDIASRAVSRTHRSCRLYA